MAYGELDVAKVGATSCLKDGARTRRRDLAITNFKNKKLFLMF